MLLKDKIAIVTGATQGIGKGIAKLYSENDAIVAVCSRNEERARAAAAEIEKATGNKTIPVAVDVSKKSEVDNAVNKVVSIFGRIDVLVNNAGIQEYMPFLEMDELFWDRHFDINVKGTFLFSQAVIRVMMDKGGCKIVNLSSDSGVAPVPEYASAYCSTKSAINGLTRVIAKEFGQYGIYCNAICSGGIYETGMFENYKKTFGRDEADVELTALKRLGTVEDVANVALFLASSLSNHVTGERILVTGGDIMTQ